MDKPRKIFVGEHFIIYNSQRLGSFLVNLSVQAITLDTLNYFINNFLFSGVVGNIAVYLLFKGLYKFNIVKPKDPDQGFYYRIESIFVLPIVSD